MDESQFKSLVLRAETMRDLAPQPEDAAYWSGYLYGLRRHYHGQNFGNSQENAAYEAISPKDHFPLRRLLGQGYRAGVQGLEPLALTGACPTTETP